MDGTCAFCGEHKPLRDSHVLPAFVFRWLRYHSGSGHIRSSENPNKRVQDGLKFPWLCGDCEGRFGRYETAFATNAFHPWNSGEYRIAYEEWLIKFCVSVSWRILKYVRGRHKNTSYSNKQMVLMDAAEARWRAFLNDEVPHPAQFEQHILILDIIESTTISDLPPNFNRFMTGAVTFDIIGSEQAMMTFAKLGRFTILGMIQKGADRWEGTKVHLKGGVLKPGKVMIPQGLLGLLKSKAEQSAAAMSKISPTQRAKIEKNILTNLDVFRSSGQFVAMMADASMFGNNSIFLKDES